LRVSRRYGDGRDRKGDGGDGNARDLAIHG
jgi:hypothetical protein